MRIYFAASLFTLGERTWNRALAKAMREAMPDLDVRLPQDFETGEAHSQKAYGVLFRQCVAGVDDADVVVAIIDGDEVDSGTAWEMGYAYARGKPIIGVRTDYRPGAEHGVNIMLSRSCRHFIREYSFQEDMALLAKDIVRQIRKVKAGLTEK